MPYATRQRPSVQTDLIARLYDRLAVVYDIAFGPLLQAGRAAALRRMAICPGDRVLEIGVGTGLNIALYPPYCDVTGIDLSEAMLAKAHKRIRQHQTRHVQVLKMDAADLLFPDDCFDVVYAPYVISVVADPVAVAREMIRVCRPGGRLVILGHFRSERTWLARLECRLTSLTLRLGFKADLHLMEFLEQSDLHPVSLEKVNRPPLWSLVTCMKTGGGSPR